MHKDKENRETTLYEIGAAVIYNGPKEKEKDHQATVYIIYVESLKTIERASFKSRPMRVSAIHTRIYRHSYYSLSTLHTVSITEGERKSLVIGCN